MSRLKVAKGAAVEVDRTGTQLVPCAVDEEDDIVFGDDPDDPEAGFTLMDGDEPAELSEDAIELR